MPEMPVAQRRGFAERGRQVPIDTVKSTDTG